MKKLLTVLFVFIIFSLLLSNNVKAQAVPNLSVPANTSTWELTTPTLYWWYIPYIYSTGPFNYQVQLGIHPTDFSGGNLIINQSVAGSNSAYYTVPDGLLGVGSTYYWRVGVGGYYSQTWSFTPSVGNVIGTPINLTTPVIVSPANASINLAQPISFSWNSVNNATSYKVQIASDNAFTILVKDTIVNSTSVDIGGLQSLTTYYWKVRAQSFNGISPWSSVYSFSTVLTPPSIVILLAPLNNSISPVTNPVLSWSTVSNADTYELQVSTNNLFSIIVYSSSGITDSQKQVSGLQNNTQYYWRVRAVNTAGAGSWSYQSRFTVNVPLPATPVLISPADNDLDVPVNHEFSWNYVAYSDSFQLQIATDDLFNNLVVNTTLADTSFQASNLAFNTNHFWRVRAKSVVGWGNWAQLRFFRTRKAPPGAPILVSPVSGSFSTNYEFQWNNGPNASEVIKYKMQVSLTGSFVTGLKTYTDINKTSQLVEGLLSQSVYYWRVKAYTATDSSQWSTVETFNTFLNSKTIYVNGSTGDDLLNNGTLLMPFKTISRAFAEANINAFDTIKVADGFYPEEIMYGGGFALVGSEHTSILSLRLTGQIFYKYVKNFELVYSALSVNTGLIFDNAKNAYVENITFNYPGIPQPLIVVSNSTNIKMNNISVDNLVRGILIDLSSYIEINNVQLNGVNSITPDGYGLSIRNSDNIDVNNLSTEKQEFGIVLNNVSEINFNNTSIKNTIGAGLLIGPSYNLTFNETYIDNCSRGVWIEPDYALLNNTLNIIESNNNGIKNNNYSVKSVNSLTTADNITFTGYSEIKNNQTNGIYAYGPGGVSSVNSLKIDGDIHLINNGSAGFSLMSQITLSGKIGNPLIQGCTFSNAPNTGNISFVTNTESNTISGAKINNNIFDTEPNTILIYLNSLTSNNVDARNNSFPRYYSLNQINTSIYDSLDYPSIGFVDLTGLDYGSEYGPTISIQSVPNAYKGASYYLDVEITTDGNSYNFLKGHFTYDTTFAKYLGYVSDGLINQNAWSSLNISDSTAVGSIHAVRFSAFGLTPINQNGKLFRLYFKIQPNASTGTPLISGYPTNFYGNNVSGAFKIINGTLTISDPPGPIQSKGDVTLDAVVTMDDFMALLYHLNGSIILTDPQALENADFNNDTAINNLDLNALYTFLNPGMPIVNPNIVSGRLAIENISYKNDSYANIPIIINDASDINNVVVRLNYDPAHVNFNAFEKNTELGGTYVYGYENKPGEAVFVFQSKQLHNGKIATGDMKVGFVENHIPIGSVVTTQYSVNGNEFVNGPNFRFDYNGITGVEEHVEEELPTQFNLSQNYPNPFNPSTKINYSLPQAAQVRVIIYDVLGREVKTLINSQQNAGRYTVNWHSDDNYGNRVASGIYIYRIVAGNFVSTKKMMLLK